MPSACVPREGTAVVQTQSARVCTKRWLPHSTRCGCEPPITSSRKHRVDSCIKAGCYRGSDGAAPSSSRTARSQPAYTSGTSPPHTCAAIFPANTPSTRATAAASPPRLPLSSPSPSSTSPWASSRSGPCSRSPCPPRPRAANHGSRAGAAGKRSLPRGGASHTDEACRRGSRGGGAPAGSCPPGRVPRASDLACGGDIHYL